MWLVYRINEGYVVAFVGEVFGCCLDGGLLPLCAALVLLVLAVQLVQGLLLFLSLVKAAQISFGKQVDWLGYRFAIALFLV